MEREQVCGPSCLIPRRYCPIQYLICALSVPESFTLRYIYIINVQLNVVEKCMHYHIILAQSRAAIISERCLLPFPINLPPINLRQVHGYQHGQTCLFLNLVSGLYSTHSHLLLSGIKSSWENKLSHQRMPIKGAQYLCLTCAQSHALLSTPRLFIRPTTL